MLFRVIPQGDIDFTTTDSGLLRPTILTGPEYVRQKIATRLKFFLGEWFRDLREGMPYYRVALGMNPDMRFIRTLFRRGILSVQEVAAVTSLNLAHDKKARTLAVSFQAQLVDGGTLVVRQPDIAFVISLAEPSA